MQGIFLKNYWKKDNITIHQELKAMIEMEKVKKL